MNLHYKSSWLQNHINSNIVGIVPSRIPDEISSIVPEKIWNTMHKEIQKDLEELFNVYYYQQWTATSLMACRILERVLKIHVECDLKANAVMNIGDAIKEVKKSKYFDSNSIKELYDYQEQRNSFMHGNKRASGAEAKDLVGYVMKIAMRIHNIKP